MKKRSVVSVKGLVAACCAFCIACLTATNVWADAVSDLRKKAEQGDATSQRALGRRYLFGDGVSQDIREGAKWTRKCAEQGDAVCQYVIGRLLQAGPDGLPQGVGEGLPQDFQEAAKWYRKAADQGNADAAWQLARLYASGRGVPKDIDVAVEWMHRAASHGHEEAQKALHEMGLTDK